MKFSNGKIPYNKGKTKNSILKNYNNLIKHNCAECPKHGIHEKWYIINKNRKYIKCALCSTIDCRNSRNRNFIKRILYDCSRRGLEFNLDKEFIENLLIKQNNRCALSGIIFDENNKISIDRIDSKKGYLKDNIQLILYDINRMKTNYDLDLFLEICYKIDGYRNV